MPSFETFLLVGFGLLLVAGAVVLFAILRERPRATGGGSATMGRLARGEFRAALEGARTDARAPRGELYAAAVAARHLLELEVARGLLDRLLAADPNDGEAWLEAGLVAAYGGDAEGAERAFARAAAVRSDLLESITLHRAWLALRQGDRRAARARFEEVEASLESKLRSDLGPGDPLFAEWFLQAAALWEAAGESERAAWAFAAGRAAAPESRLAEALAPRSPSR